MKIVRAEKGVKRGEPFNIFVDGEVLTAYAGETVAGVMLTGDRPLFNQSCKENSPRSIFCGIGVCYGCQVTIDNVPSQRACQTPARAGMRIKSETKTNKNHGNL